MKEHSLHANAMNSLFVASVRLNTLECLNALQLKRFGNFYKCYMRAHNKLRISKLVFSHQNMKPLRWKTKKVSMSYTTDSLTFKTLERTRFG